MKDPMRDPKTGANIVHTLTQSFHMNAICRADLDLIKDQRARSRLRRGRELVGPEEIANREQRFSSVGNLEIIDRKDSKLTETDSLVDNSNYELLHDDLDGFKSFYNRRK